MKVLDTLRAMLVEAQGNPRYEPERVLVSAAAMKELQADRECDPFLAGDMGTVLGVPISKDDRIAPALLRVIWRDRGALPA